MSPVFFLVAFAAYATRATVVRNRGNYVYNIGSLRPYPPPVFLPMLPYYDIDIPDQEGKMFGHVAATKYETIIVKETVRPVCLYVDANVPSCDRVHDNYYNGRPKKPTAGNGRRPAVVDYDSYFIEPSRPDEKIEITEIPFRGAFLLTGTTVEQTDDDHVATDAAQETPPLQAPRPVTEDVQERRAAREAGAGQRQMLQNALNTAVAAGLSGAVAAGLSGAVANAGGAVLNAGGALFNAGGAVANAGGGGGRQQVTVYVTRVDKVLDGRVTATLVPKNCMPGGGRVDALRPCAAADPYQADYAFQQQPAQQKPQPLPQQHQQTAADVVSKVDGLVRHGPQVTADGYRHRFYASPQDCRS